MTEKEKIDAAVAKALEKALEEAAADTAKAVEAARAEAEKAQAQAVKDAQDEAEKAKAQAVEDAVAEARAEADKEIAEIVEGANRAINDAHASGLESGAESVARGGRTDKLRHFVVVSASFIGGSLLAPGSRVTSDELGTYKDPRTGEQVPVKPGETLVEVNADGSPVDDAAADKLAAVAGDAAGIPIAAVQPFSPNPTRPQGAPGQPAGGVSLAEGQLRTLPAEGVESNAAAEARAEQGENAAAAVAAMTAGDRPRRRGASS